MNTKSYEITDACTFYLISRQPSDHLSKLATLLVSGDLSRRVFDSFCVEWGLQDSPSFKEELLDLLLFYIEYCLKDHALTSDEKLSIRELKLLFRIKEDDFYKFKQPEVKDLLVNEVSRILEDKSVDKVEALHQVDLQEIFGLSYDQYLRFTREPVGEIIDDVIAKITADNIVTDEEREELIQQIIALDTVYRLNAKQKKIVFGD
jgi:hypothetical protein